MQSLTRSELQGLLGLPPPPARNWKVTSERIEDGLRFRTYLLGDERVPAVSLARAEARTGAPAVLYCHAHGNAYAIGKSEVLDGRAALLAPPLAEEIARAGSTVLCADMPGFGERLNNGKESALAKSALWRGQTLIGQMVSDQLLALDVLKDSAEPSKVTALGISMGGTLAYLVAALREDVSAVAHLCVFANIAPLIESGAHDLHGPYMTLPGLLPRHDLSDIAALIAPRPQLVATGGMDPLTPREAYDPAIARLKTAYDDHLECLTILRDPATGHQETPEMRRTVLAFLSEPPVGTK